MKPSNHRVPRVLAALLAFSLIAAACSSGSGGTSPPATSTSEGTSPPATSIAGGNNGSGEVTIGVLVPLTGELGEFGKTVANAIEFGVKEVNDAGGTKCGKLRTVVADTGGNPETAIREANTMIGTQGAVAILGPTSGVMVALVDLVHRKKVVLMSPYAGSITLNKLGGNFVYRTVASDLSDGAAAGLWLSSRGYKSVAILIQNDESTISVARVAQNKIKAAGIDITDSVTYNPGQPSYQAVLTPILAHPPDAIFLAGGQESGVTVIKEAIAGGFKGQWLFTADLAVPGIFKTVGAGLLNNKAFVESAQPDPSLPAFVSFKKNYADADKPFAANSYDMVNLVALALQASSQCDGTAINSTIRDVADTDGTHVSTFAKGRDVLASGGSINYDGASGPLTFDKSGTVSGSYSIQEAEGGKWVTVKFYPASTFVG